MSEAVDDTSMSAINTLVQQLIEKEFNVFASNSRKLDQLNKQQQKEERQLEQTLKILKALHYLCNHIHMISNQGIKLLMNIGQQAEEEMEKQFSDYDLQIALSQVHPNIFHHHKLDLYILKNIQDPYNIVGGGITDTLQQIFRNCSFLFPFQTRQLFFKLVSFIGAIDMNRSIYFLRQYIKQKGGKLVEDKNSNVKIQKQKFIVDRNRVIECTISLMSQLNKRQFLEIEYENEIGTGLGPTMEYYYLLSEDLKKTQDLWRQRMADNSLFPAPVCPQKPSNDLKKMHDLFRVVGTMVAKSIVDDRLFDLPISSLFWDLLLGKVIILPNVCRK